MLIPESDSDSPWSQSSDPVVIKLANGSKRMESGCIEWMKSKCPAGYGFTCWNGKNHRAHRASYAASKGLSQEDIKGLVIRHKCDNPSCINPSHLVPGTSADNVRDMDERGRRTVLSGEKHGMSKLTEQQVKEIRASYICYSRKFGTRALGRKYGVDSTTISLIVRGKKWAAI